MSKKNGGNLAEDFSGLLNNIKGSFDVRIKSLGETVSDTRQILGDAKDQIGEFKKNREEMAEDLRNFLNKFKLNLQNENFERFEDFQKFFDKLSSENSEAAKELRSFLKKHKLDRLQDFFKFMKPVQNTLHSMHNHFKNFQEQMNHRRAKPFGFHTGPVSLMRKSNPRKGEPEIKGGQSFKIKSKGKRHKSK